jgi:hypothetical protein
VGGGERASDGMKIMWSAFIEGWLRDDTAFLPDVVRRFGRVKHALQSRFVIYTLFCSDL